VPAGGGEREKRSRSGREARTGIAVECILFILILLEILFFTNS
jgi:hypothetical protein